MGCETHRSTHSGGKRSRSSLLSLWHMKNPMISCEISLIQTSSRDCVGVCTVHAPDAFMWFTEAKMSLRQSCRCVLCLRKSQSKSCQSPYTSWICGSFVYWQEEQCDKTAGRLASISPLQALRLTLYTVLDALNSSPKNCLPWSSSKACSAFWLENCRKAEHFFFFLPILVVFN